MCHSMLVVIFSQIVGFVKFVKWISRGCYLDLSKLIWISLSCKMDLSKFVHECVKVVTWICQSGSMYILPIGNKTKIKFVKDFKAC